MPEGPDAETDFSRYPFPTLYRVHQKGFSFVCFKELLQTPSFPPLGSLARVPCRQPQECFFPCSFPTPCPFTGKGGEGSMSRVNLRVHLCPSQGSAHPSRGDRSPHGGEGLGHFVGSPRPSWALPTQRGTRANAAPSVPAAPSRARVGPGRVPDSGQPGSRGSLPPPRPPLTWLAL